MPIGVSEEHEALGRSVRRWVEAHTPPEVVRAGLELGREELPPFWSELARQGWLGLHLPEQHGGEGYGLPELAVVLEELGRACVPGPFLPTVLAGAAIATWGGERLRAQLLPGLAAGSILGTLAFGAGSMSAEPVDAGLDGGVTLRLDGSVRPVLGGTLADVAVVPASSAEGEVWCVVRVADLEVEALDALDGTRGLAEVRARGAEVGPDERLTPAATEQVAGLAAVLIAAECAGGAGWCVDTAASHAKVREQFGRPIGQFQAVKHRCADMLVAAEGARAAAWDAARAPLTEPSGSLAAAVAAVVAPDAFLGCAKDCIQVLGGMGFTWEHDAHLYLRRAVALRQLLGRSSAWQARVARLALAGARRTLDVTLPEDSVPVRDEVRAFAASLAGLDGAETPRRLADHGYLAPHWPRPWGRDAGAVEQLVIDQELRRARVRRPHLAVGAWALPTIIAHGTPEQQERWVRPTLYRGLAWRQMFSEPGAGSDLASLSTKATRSSGGWMLSGQKVWTSMAAEADWAICLARTSADAPKHRGITYFIVDVAGEGIDVRPLRELTGQAMFNEVFLSDVFVPDDCVIGAVDDGWRLARTTLANERVSMGTGSSFGLVVDTLLQLVARLQRPEAAEGILAEVGQLLAESSTLAVLGLRTTLRALGGAEPGPESSGRKLAGAEHDQRVQELGLSLLGPEGSTTVGEAATWTDGFLANRCLTIAGGTSEIQRNVIAERLLGLPKDP